MGFNWINTGKLFICITLTLTSGEKSIIISVSNGIYTKNKQQQTWAAEKKDSFWVSY